MKTPPDVVEEKHFTPKVEIPLTEKETQSSDRLYNGSMLVRKRRAMAKAMLKKKRGVDEEDAATNHDGRVPNVRIDTVKFRQRNDTILGKIGGCGPNPVNWPKSRFTLRKDGWWYYTQKSNLPHWTPNRVSPFRHIDEGGRKWDGEEMKRGFLPHPPPKDQRYYLVGPDRRPLAIKRSLKIAEEKKEETHVVHVVRVEEEEKQIGVEKWFHDGKFYLVSRKTLVIYSEAGEEVGKWGERTTEGAAIPNEVVGEEEVWLKH